MRRLGNAQSFKTYMFRFELFAMNGGLGLDERDPGLPHLDTFTWQIVTPADRVTLRG